MKKTLLFLTACTVALSAFAWGQKGHDTVANIAERHFTEATADSVGRLLEGMSPVYWANWLDNASHTPEYAYSKTWHYKNIDADQNYDDVPPFESGDIITALRAQIAVLKDPTAADNRKNLALKMVIHLVGDMHQPMHMGHKSDLGGNRTQVRFFNSGTNLHTVWDTRLPEAAHAWTYTEWTDQLDRLSPEAAEQIGQGNLDDWAKESWQEATRIYEAFPSGSQISYNEIAEWTPVVERQLLKGGLRLATILNAIFDPASTRNPSDF